MLVTYDCLFACPSPPKLRDALETKVGNVSATLNLLQEYSESDSSEFRVSYLFNLPAMLVVYG